MRRLAGNGKCVCYDHLSRFRTITHQVFTTQKAFPGEIPLTIKLQHQIRFKHVLIMLAQKK